MELASLLSTAEELISIRSTADRPDELARALDLILDLVGPGFVVERFSPGHAPSALVYPNGPRPDFRVLLNAHLDVVPAGADQFVPRRDGDRLYGRGTHDMKVAAIVLAQAFRDLARAVPYALGLQLVTDEEVGGRHGTGYQLEQGVTARFVLIGEQSGLRIVTESKGLARVQLRATGRAGHAAYPWLADNAIVRLTRSIDRLLQEFPTPATEAWTTTVNVARIASSNHALNVVPADAQAWLDIRYPPQDSRIAGRAPAELAELLGGHCEPGVAVLVDHIDPPHHADPHRSEVDILARAVRDVGFSGELLRKHGAADARYFHQRGIDAVIFGPGGAGQHTDAEYIDLGTVGPYSNALVAFLRQLDDSQP